MEKLEKDSILSHFTGLSSLSSEVLDMKSPIQFFYHFCTSEMFEQIADSSALYSTQQKLDKPSRISATDIKQFIEVCFYMSLIRLSYTRNYWSSEFRISQVADVLTCNVFGEIKRVLHFSN